MYCHKAQDYLAQLLSGRQRFLNGACVLSSGLPEHGAKASDAFAPLLDGRQLTALR
jgi:hypothetical protein